MRPEGESDGFIERVGEYFDELGFFPDLDDAIIGIAQQWSKPPLVVYDYDLLVKHFQKANGWTREEATEWVDFNVVQAWHGERTPLIMESRQRLLSNL